MLEGSPLTIEADRHGYYDALECAQRDNEVAAWVRWFAGMVVRAQREAQTQVRFLLGKHHFFLNFRGQLNARQEKVLRRMFEAGPEEEFTGGMSARKFIALTGASKATATRDLQHLASIGALFPLGEGRAMRYRLANEKKTPGN